MVLILLCGALSLESVVEMLGVSVACVYDRISRYHAKGMNSFADATRSGRPSLLSNEEQQALVEMLENEPENWTCQRLNRDMGAKAPVLKRRVEPFIHWVM